MLHVTCTNTANRSDSSLLNRSVFLSLCLSRVCAYLDISTRSFSRFVEHHRFPQLGNSAKKQSRASFKCHRWREREFRSGWRLGALDCRGGSGRQGLCGESLIVVLRGGGKYDMFFRLRRVLSLEVVVLVLSWLFLEVEKLCALLMPLVTVWWFPWLLPKKSAPWLLVSTGR